MLDSSKTDMSGLACFIPIFAEGLAKDPPAYVRRTKYSAKLSQLLRSYPRVFWHTSNYEFLCGY